MDTFSFSKERIIKEKAETHYLNGEDLSVAIGDFIRKKKNVSNDDRFTFEIRYTSDQEKAGTKDWIEIEVKIKPLIN